MDYMRIGKLSEPDFDAIIIRAGGSRVAEDDSREKEPNADYALNDAIIELKLVEEEGLEKAERQRKLAELFREQNNNRPVIVLDPRDLDGEGLRRYYSIMSGPLKGHVKKAAKQLDHTQGRLGTGHARVLLLVNNGYSALTHEEFAQIAVKCVRNDTRKVDAVVVAGMYYYSDRFDQLMLFPIDLHAVNVDRPFGSFECLRTAWNAFAEQFMTDLIQGNAPRLHERLPVIDLTFEVDGARFVKPAPQMGRPSSFWVDGRPRENSTGIEKCPPVAEIFPRLSQAEWERFKGAMPEDLFFRDDFDEWRRFAAEEEAADQDPLQPFVFVDVTYAEFETWCRREKRKLSSQLLCNFTARRFSKTVRELMERARERSASSIVPLVYVLLRTQEIGQDKANDVSSIVLVREVPGSDAVVRDILTNVRVFFEYALAIAAAYACKYGVDALMYEKDRTYAWV